MLRITKKYGLLSMLSVVILGSSMASASSADRIWGGVVGGLIG